jgi:hypothetical protein
MSFVSKGRNQFRFCITGHRMRDSLGRRTGPDLAIGPCWADKGIPKQRSGLRHGSGRPRGSSQSPQRSDFTAGRLDHCHGTCIKYRVVVHPAGASRAPERRETVGRFEGRFDLHRHEGIV